EEKAEDVLQQLAEVGQQRAPGLDHRGEGGGVGHQSREGAAVVGVALDPAVLARRDEDRARCGHYRAGTGTTPGAHQSRPSISRSICAISARRPWTWATGRPPCCAWERIASTLPRMWRIFVCASTAARVRSSLVSQLRSA